MVYSVYIPTGLGELSSPSSRSSMGWHMKLVICVQLAYVSVCLTQLSVVREWTSLDVQLPPEYGQESRRSIVPSEIKSWLLYKDRLLVSVDRRPDLVYLNLTDNSTSPLLQPYPSWEDQEDQYNMYIGMSAFPRVDRCDRMWLLDNVYNQSHILNNIIVLDLNTDSILRKHLFNLNMEAMDVAVDDLDCENEYIYIQSLDFESGWTYSWAEGDSWYHSWDNVTATVLTPNGSDMDSIVYYNKRNLSEVFSISTTHLRNKTSDLTGLERRRGLNVELASSVFDAKRDVLYYFKDDNKTVIHAVPCWTDEGYGLKVQDIDVGFDPTHQLKYITLDKNGDLWAVTSKSRFEVGEINFRLLSVPVRSTHVESKDNDAAKTSTDAKLNVNAITNTTKIINEIATAANSTMEQTATLGSVPKHTTVNIADTTTGMLHNINITQAVGGTDVNYVNINLFSFTNFTINNNFPYNNFH